MTPFILKNLEDVNKSTVTARLVVASGQGLEGAKERIN